MSEKKDEEAHGLEDEVDHIVNSEHTAGHTEKVSKESATDEKVRRNGRKKEKSTKHWENSELVKLVNGEVLRSALHEICQQLTNSFHVSDIYSCEDLEQDVIELFAEWFSQYRSEAQPKTVLRKIAYNQLVNQFRKRDNRCPHYESLKLKSRKPEAVDIDEGEEFEGGELGDRYSDSYQNSVADKEERRILLNELKSMLTSEERSLYSKHFDEGWTETEIAKELRVSRQAVSKRIKRILRKMKLSLSHRISPIGDPGSVRQSRHNSQNSGLI